jgi:hypothetical protein
MIPHASQNSEIWGIPPSTMARMKKSTTILENSSELAREARALVALAFRNEPVEDVHTGKTWPTCHGKANYSHITQSQMRQIMKAAVDQSTRS